MKKYNTSLPPEDIYPIDDWNIIQNQFAANYEGQDETLFALSNGYIGMRGNFEEVRPNVQLGTYVNGFYEKWPIKYGEKAYGFAENGQSMVRAPETKIIKFYIDDEPLFLPTAQLNDYCRTLNMQEAILDRNLIWETPTGRQVSIKTRRMVSMEYRHLVFYTYEVVLLKGSGNIIISSQLVNEKITKDNPDIDDPRKGENGLGDALLGQHIKDVDSRIVFAYRTKKSDMRLACGIDHVITTDNEHRIESKMFEDSGKIVFYITAEEGVPILIEKYASYHTSRSAEFRDLGDRVERTLDRSMDLGRKALFESQKNMMQNFWSVSDVSLTSKNKRMQQAIRFNLFHVGQASQRAEGTGVGARGLTGTAYDGHYFWDTEIYVLPFLIYTDPGAAKNLLKFRYTVLDKARERAAQVNQKGALFPWRTINGEESSAFFAAGTAQYHINADIMYALKKYVKATGDTEFLYQYGAEILVETARLWFDLGSYPNGSSGEFHIHGVTGPDEYTALVNNNLYTNLMARENLQYAVDTISCMQQEGSKYINSLTRKTNLKLEEVQGWKEAAEKMYIPYSDELKIHKQDDNFLERDKWNLEETPVDKFPLLLHYHPLVLYRHQVIKQADVVMAMFLLGNHFTAEEKKRNFDYYDPLTTGDSSLSDCIQGIIAQEIGYMDQAEGCFFRTAFTDLGNVHGNVVDGAHIAAMGGTWMGLVYGMGGMRDQEENISFNPRLGKEISRLTFSILIHGNQLQVDIHQNHVTYYLLTGDKVTIKHQEQDVNLVAKKPVKFDIEYNGEGI